MNWFWFGPVCSYLQFIGLDLKALNITYRALYANSGRHLLVMSLYPHTPLQTIYRLKCQIVPGETLMVKSVVHPIDYDVLHKCFGHASKDALKHLKASIRNLPVKEVVFPKKDTLVCKGCTEGKMPL